MIRNSFSEILDLIIIEVTPTYVKNETVSNLLDGTWHIQTIGSRAQKLRVEAICSSTVIDELQGYADTKEQLTVTYLGVTVSGVIIGELWYELFAPGVLPTYRTMFEVAVIPSV